MLIRIALLDDFAEGKTIKFEFEREGISYEGFAARVEGKIVAYENVCRHLPLSLDYGDNQFFTRDGKHFICHSHGAIYEPLTGLCVRGPCAGASLKALGVELRDQEVWVETEIKGPPAE